jgi:acyl-CoA synthetase (NDP forming)
MSVAREILEAALKRNQRALSEFDSKQLLSVYGIPVARGAIAREWNEIREAASSIGYPVVLKFCSPEITHKTEKRLIEIDIRDEKGLHEAYQRISKEVKDADKGFIVEEMIKGSRELVIGMTRDSQFGPCVMFGLGGIFTEVLNDVCFRVAPIEKRDALEMMQEIKANKILQPIRGMEAVDLDELSQAIISLGKIGLENESVEQIDVNPLIIKKGKPIAADALVILRQTESELS